MQFARAGVRVVDAGDVVFVAHERVELGDVGGQVGHGHGGVLYDVARLGVAHDVGHDALAGAAQLPDPGAIVAPEHREGVTEASGAQVGLEGAHLPLEGSTILMADFDDEDGAGVALHEETVLRLFEVGLGALEDVAVDQFDGVRAMPQSDKGGVERLLYRSEVGAEKRSRRGQRVAVQLELNADEKRALGAGDKPAEVERLVRRRVEHGAIQQRVEGVAGIAAGDRRFGEVIGDEPAVLRVAEQVAHGAVNAGFVRVRASAFGREFSGREWTEGGHGAVAEKAAGGDEVLARATVDDRVGAAGVVADHAADHRAVGSGGLGGEEQAMRLEEKVEHVAHDARLHAHTALRDVEGHDAIEVAADVDDYAAPHDLAGQRSAGGARDQAHAVFAGESEERAQVGFAARQRDRHGQLLVFGGVGGIDATNSVVVAQLAL